MAPTTLPPVERIVTGGPNLPSDFPRTRTLGESDLLVKLLQLAGGEPQPAETLYAAAEQIREWLDCSYVWIDYGQDPSAPLEQAGSKPKSHTLLDIVKQVEERVIDECKPAHHWCSLGHEQICVVSIPLRSASGHSRLRLLSAVYACRTKEASERFAERVRQIAWTLSAIYEPLLATAARDIDSARYRLFEKACKYTNPEQFAYAVANGLVSSFGFANAYFGTMRGSHVRLSCVAGLTSFDPNGPLSRLISASMEEAADAGRPICAQPVGYEDSHPNHQFALTEKWQRSAGNVSVASVPLMDESGRCVAVIGVQGRQQIALQKRDLQCISSLAGPLAAALALLDAGNRSLVRHARDTFVTSFSRLFRSSRGYHAVGAILALISLAWVLLGQMDYIVRVPCKTAAGSIVQMSAPFAGQISKAFVRPGDRVREGELLFEMSADEQELLKKRAASSVRAAQIEIAQASLQDSAAITAQSISRLEAAKAELVRLERQLAMATVRAPFTGIVMDSDAHRRIGESVLIGDPLCTIAPVGESKLVAHVPESCIEQLQPGLRGDFITLCRPDVSQECRLERLAPKAEIIDGQNVFFGYADIAEGGPIRPGLTGIARFNAGPRRIWWIWFRRITDTARIHHWSLFGASEAGPER